MNGNDLGLFGPLESIAGILLPGLVLVLNLFVLFFLRRLWRGVQGTDRELRQLGDKLDQLSDRWERRAIESSADRSIPSIPAVPSSPVAQAPGPEPDWAAFDTAAAAPFAPSIPAATLPDLGEDFDLDNADLDASGTEASQPEAEAAGFPLPELESAGGPAPEGVAEELFRESPESAPPAPAMVQAAPAEPPAVQKVPAVVRLPGDPQRPDILLARCGGCGHKLAYKESLAGKRVKCPACQQVFVLP